MKLSDFKGMSVKDLNSKANELKGQIFEASIKNKIGQLSNPLTIRQMRRDLARVLTVLSQKRNG